MKTYVAMMIATFFCISCTKTTQSASDKWIAEVEKAESDFQAMAADKGIHDAFVAFADSNAVILRGDSLLSGKIAISDYYQRRESANTQVTVTWKPDFVEVSSSGDLAYTYGGYVYNTTDSIGNKHVFKGIFHTVWKRQADGSWKYVWD
jgi:ketosteroid isomerase-like protein